MLPLAALSRRALGAVAGAAALALAVGPEAEARTRKPPLAFAAVVVTHSDNGLGEPDPPNTFRWHWRAPWQCPSLGREGQVSGLATVSVKNSQGEMRAAIARDAAGRVSQALGGEVAADRVAVTIF